MVNDPIGDMLITLKNASRIKKAVVSVPYSKMKEAVANVLVKEGFLSSVEVKGKKVTNKVLAMVLAEKLDKTIRLTDVRRISKPGCRVYSPVQDLNKSKRGIMVVSTSEGLLTNKQAMVKKLGGELLFAIW
jgi:small subunit ribosomal protein S8